MLAADDLDALWVVGANPLKEGPLASKKAFVVVQDMFLTETAQRADVVLPAASAYEKNGTVTNVCGEVQRLKRAISTIGRQAGSRNHRPDRARKWASRRRWARGFRKRFTTKSAAPCKGYDIPLRAGRPVGAQQTTPVNGRVRCREPSGPDLVRAR